ncbi:UNVERIFIED_CONTAM: protein ALWAYS EARLY 3 [Sesamum calycinum]|uniref:Protein ALWAYS EARLY 3 n=1 Tax=Sesamum calycinum TaxID=2727403 RepID=A0AAW2QKA4_9LAMI
MLVKFLPAKMVMVLKEAMSANSPTRSLVIEKRKLSDMLGPRWTMEELARFYDAYRKYGKDWKKVAGAVRNRSAEMVEALYMMNRLFMPIA